MKRRQRMSYYAAVGFCLTADGKPAEQKDFALLFPDDPGMQAIAARVCSLYLANEAAKSNGSSVCGAPDALNVCTEPALQTFADVINTFNAVALDCGLEFNSRTCNIPGFQPITANNQIDFENAYNTNQANLANFLVNRGAASCLAAGCCRAVDIARPQCSSGPDPNVPNGSNDATACWAAQLGLAENQDPGGSGPQVICAENFAHMLGRTAEVVAAAVGIKCCCNVSTNSIGVSPAASLAATVTEPMTYSDPRGGGNGFDGAVQCACNDPRSTGINLGGVFNELLNPLYRAHISACSCPTATSQVSQGAGATDLVCSGAGICKLTQGDGPVSYGPNSRFRYAGGKCVCAPGYVDVDCGRLEKDNCPISAKVNVPGVVTGEACGGNGTCSSSETSNGCLCNPGWTGVACDSPICIDTSKAGKTPNLQPCNGNGTCFYGVCDCQSGYTGRFCERHEDTNGESGGGTNGGPTNGAGARGQKTSVFKKKIASIAIVSALTIVMVVAGLFAFGVFRARKKRYGKVRRSVVRRSVPSK